MVAKLTPQKSAWACHYDNCQQSATVGQIPLSPGNPSRLATGSAPLYVINVEEMRTWICCSQLRSCRCWSRWCSFFQIAAGSISAIPPVAPSVDSAPACEGVGTLHFSPSPSRRSCPRRRAAPSAALAARCCFFWVSLRMNNSTDPAELAVVAAFLLAEAMFARISEDVSRHTGAALAISHSTLAPVTQARNEADALRGHTGSLRGQAGTVSRLLHDFVSSRPANGKASACTAVQPRTAVRDGLRVLSIHHRHQCIQMRYVQE